MDLHRTLVLEAIRRRLAADGEIPPGRYDVSGSRVVIEVNGELLKSEDEQYVPTTSIPVIPALMLALEKAGAVGDNIINLVAEAMTEAIALEEKGDEHLKDLLRRSAAAEDKVRSMLATLPPKTRSGKINVRAELAVEVVPGPGLR